MRTYREAVQSGGFGRSRYALSKETLDRVTCPPSLLGRGADVLNRLARLRANLNLHHSGLGYPLDRCACFCGHALNHRARLRPQFELDREKSHVASLVTGLSARCRLETASPSISVFLRALILDLSGSCSGQGGSAKSSGFTGSGVGGAEQRTARAATAVLPVPWQERTTVRHAKRRRLSVTTLSFGQRKAPSRPMLCAQPPGTRAR